jgi:SPP1 gp7 family putative phage head morphogenesis protein
MRKRFDKLIRLIRTSVWEEDVFGLAPRPTIFQTPGERAFEFTTSEEKIELYIKWIEEQIAAEALEITGAIPKIGDEITKHWTDFWVHSAYQKGIQQARDELRKMGFDIPDFEGITRGGQYLGLEFNKRVHSERIGNLYTRVFQELKGITADMETKLTRILAQGIADGLSPRQLARELTSVLGDDLNLVDKLGRFIPAKRRAEMLARTEIIRAHSEANITEYEELGVKELRWVYGGVRSCEICEGRNGKKYPIKETRGMIPVHPNCGCAWAPVIEIPD